MVGKLWRSLATAVVIGGVFTVAALASVAENKPFAAVFWGAVGAVAGGFAPDVVTWLSARQDRRAGRLGGAARVHDADPDSSVAWLLHPAKEAVTFEGRDELLSDLRKWCESENTSPVRLVTAPGGYGKTRLARQLGHVLGEWGWRCERVVPLPDTEIVPGLTRSGDNGLLLVVDYAETRDREALAQLMSSVASSAYRRRTRLLLLARSAGDWWTLLGQQDSDAPGTRALLRSLTVAQNVIPLPSRADARTDAEVVASAMKDFARHLACDCPEVVPSRSRPVPTPLLLLHTEALVLVLRQGAGAGEPDVIDELLLHEESYWRNRALRIGLIPPADDETELAAQNRRLRRAVALACLFGARDDTELTGLVSRMTGLAFEETAADTVKEWLRSLYPAVVTELGDPREGGLGTLQPDLIAEHLAVTVLLGTSAQERSRLFTGLTLDQAVQVLTILGHAVIDGQAAGGLLDEVMRTDPALMAMAGIAIAPRVPGVLGPRILALLGSVEFDLEVLGLLVSVVPYPSLELGRVAVEVCHQLLDLTLDENRAEKARYLSMLSTRLAQVGKRAEALQAGQEAVILRRELAGQDPAYRPVLATSLNNRAVQLAEAGRRAEALQASQEALALAWELAEQDRDAYLPKLATSLTNHATRLAEAGKQAEALRTSEEAVALLRELAERTPDAYLPGLAASVHNHSVRLAKAGRRAEALRASRETVTLHRKLAEQNRDAYLPRLATSMSNHGVRLGEAGRRADALEASREAVVLHRELAEQNRDAYLPGLATSLNNHAVSLADAGERTEALQAGQEAIALRRELSAQNRDAHLPDLAISVSNHAIRLAEAGRRAEALRTSQEAVTLGQELTAQNRDAYLPRLATSLNIHAVHLAEAGKHGEALQTSQEAVTLRRELAEQNPDAYLPDLATSLNNHAIRLAEAGRRAEALRTSEEAVTLFKEVFHWAPGRFRGGLADTLTSHGNLLSALGQPAKADSVHAEARRLRAGA